ncbi:hepatic lectin-like [Mytilus edulis]|uniref:hepatic lectin-like n=1 Tax=Mytilus edulis TaxID=6550 RepID=UPI0039F031F2
MNHADVAVVLRGGMMCSLYQLQVLVVIFSLLSSVASRHCGNGWEHKNGRCYKFVRFRTNFVGSMYFCRYFGGGLVEIDGYNEYQTVVSLARARNFPDFYIGLTDAFSEGNWIQASSYNFQTYFSWSPGEPNNHGNQDCVQVYSADLKMDDLSCSEHMHFVCEK